MSLYEFLCPPSKKKGEIALHISVGQYFGFPQFVQTIAGEHLTP